MVEGPLLHRLAFAHRQALLGHAFQATSPSGRFADGAAAINGHVLTRIEVHGKNIFYFFTPRKVKVEGILEKCGDDAVVVHIHLGMSGSFRTYRFPGPVPREATRLRLHNESLGVEAHLSASVCAYGDIGLYRKRLLELGPDPLQEDADKEVLWESIQKTKRSIGAVLMDQSLVAGIGNIYRAEILFVVGLHPDQPANTVSRPKFEFLWDQAVRQMEIGVEVGNIITILPEDADKPLPKKRANQLRYVYNQKACGRCGGVIKVWTMAQRSVYACEVCQPPPPTVITVSKGVVKKTVADVSESEVAEIGDDVEKETNDISMQMPPRKRVAKGGKVVVHQAYKNENPEVLPESFVISPDQVESNEHLAKGGQKKGKTVQKAAPTQIEIENGIDQDSVPKARTRRKGSGNNANQSHAPEEAGVKNSAPYEKLTQRRSARIRKQVAPKADLGTATLAFRGLLEFPSSRVTKFHSQKFSTFLGRHSRGPISICRGFTSPAKVKVPYATSTLRHLIYPLSRAQPVIKLHVPGGVHSGCTRLMVYYIFKILPSRHIIDGSCARYRDLYDVLGVVKEVEVFMDRGSQLRWKKLLGSSFKDKALTGIIKVGRVGGKSTATRAFAKYPLKFLLPTKIVSVEVDVVWIFAISYGGGIVSNDSITQSVEVAPFCSAVITTQASTKIYKSVKGKSGEQTLQAHVGPDGFLAVLPDPITCFKDSKYIQVQEFYLAAGANLVLIDWMTSGRIDNGESWAFKLYRSTNHIYLGDQEGDFNESTPLFLDCLCLEQGVGISVVDRMQGFHVIANMVVYGPKLAIFRDKIQKKVQEITQKSFSRRKSADFTARLRDLSPENLGSSPEPLLFISCSTIGPSDEGLVVRAVASTTEVVYDIFKELLAHIAPIIGACPYAGR